MIRIKKLRMCFLASSQQHILKLEAAMIDTVDQWLESGMGS